MLPAGLSTAPLSRPTPELGTRRSSGRTARGPNLLELDRVSKRFGRVPVADELCLSVGETELVGVVGPNGAGKQAFSASFRVTWLQMRDGSSSPGGWSTASTSLHAAASGSAAPIRSRGRSRR